MLIIDKNTFVEALVEAQFIFALLSAFTYHDMIKIKHPRDC